MSPSTPPRAGLGLRPDHYVAVLEAGGDGDTRSRQDLDGFWVEVHPENYMTPGGPRLAALDAVAALWPVSLHGVAASLGGAEPVDADHLRRLKALVDRVEPALVSEHVAWSGWGGMCFADLLPLPTTRAALDNLVVNIDQMQTALGRRILIENPALYLALNGELEEPAFLAEACRRAGCGLLLDVNNVFVSARNLGRDPIAYIDAIPRELVGEIHLAGHAPDARLGEALLIDSHGAPVSEAVWTLCAYTIARLGPKPTLIERDENIPPFAELMAERDRAQGILTGKVRKVSSAVALDPSSSGERSEIRGPRGPRETAPSGSSGPHGLAPASPEDDGRLEKAHVDA